MSNIYEVTVWSTTDLVTEYCNVIISIIIIIIMSFSSSTAAAERKAERPHYGGRADSAEHLR